MQNLSSACPTNLYQGAVKYKKYGKNKKNTERASARPTKLY
jgi:hypothetical protein